MIKKILPGIFVLTLLTILLGFGLNTLFLILVPSLLGIYDGSLIDYFLLLRLDTYLYGTVAVVLLVLLVLLFKRSSAKEAKKLIKFKVKGFESNLENSCFMTDRERDFNFTPYKFTKLKELEKDGIPVYAQYNKKRKELDISLASPMHGLIIGATGSGKTTTFINPMIRILGNSSAGSSMICTDPKGKLFQLHSEILQERECKVMVLDLRDSYSSLHWNPLGGIYDRHQEYLHTGGKIHKHFGPVTENELELVNPIESYGEEWYEYEGKAHAVRRELLTYLKVIRQKILNELYEDLNDLISVICPIESKDDPVWEKSACSLIIAVCLAMLEDSEYPELEMIREKFRLYNISKAIGNSDNDYEALRNFFKGCPPLSKAAGLSKQVLSAAESTLTGYMSIAFDKLSMFNDEGLCSFTSAADTDPFQLAMEPMVLSLKIPDEKGTRHALATVFTLCIYKALIKVAPSQEDLSLSRNVYFILDEFGNMPKIDKLDEMIIVGRSREIRSNMVVQSYAQLNNVYGDTIANIIKSNCGMKMFTGSNDIETCEEPSKLCGNTTVSISGISIVVGDKAGNINVPSQLQTRPLIYPSELQKLNNKTDTGNAIIVAFGSYPLKTKFTPSYKCPLYQMKMMDQSDIRMNVFLGDNAYYDLEERNYIVESMRNQEVQEIQEG